MSKKQSLFAGTTTHNSTKVLNLKCMKTIIPSRAAHYRLLAKSWRAYALALVRPKTVPSSRITAPPITPPRRTFQINWGLVLCLACFGLIGILFIPTHEPLAQISHTDISATRLHHFDLHYFNPTLGSLHQLDVPGAGWVLTTYKGTVADLAKLPANPPPGDTYYCPRGGGYWVWTVMHGQTVASWIDP